MQSPQPRQNILWHEFLSIKRSRSKEIYFSQRLSYNVFLTTSLSQRLSHIVAHAYRPHNVVLTMSQYTRNLSVLYKCPNISQVQYPIISTFCDRSNWNLDVAHLQYIFFPCVKFQNPRTEASYQSAEDKVLYKYPKISQIRLVQTPVISTIFLFF